MEGQNNLQIGKYLGQTGGASNGVYDWPAISNIIDKFYDLFGNKKV